MKTNSFLSKFFLSLIMAGVGMAFVSCSSDDDETLTGNPDEIANVRSVRTPDGREYVLDKSDYVGNVSVTGTIWYSEYEFAWYVDSDADSEKDQIDGGIYYMTYAMPERFQQRGAKVKVTGDIYKYHHKTDADGNYVVMAGWDYYYLDIQDIEMLKD